MYIILYETMYNNRYFVIHENVFLIIRDMTYNDNIYLLLLYKKVYNNK